MGYSSGLGAPPSDTGTSEREVVARARTSDPEALSAIYSTYFPKVYSYGLAHLGSAEAAEDLASEVLLKVIEAVHRYEFKGVAFSAWVFRIARNQVIDVRRRRSRRREVALVESMAVGDWSADAQVQRALDRNLLRTAMRYLTEEQRRVVRLRFLEGHDNESVSRILGRSESAVKSLQHRAMNSMRRRLTGRHTHIRRAAVGHERREAAVSP